MSLTVTPDMLDEAGVGLAKTSSEVSAACKGLTSVSQATFGSSWHGPAATMAQTSETELLTKVRVTETHFQSLSTRLHAGATRYRDAEARGTKIMGPIFT